jgi:small subunit ribosomal protein S4
MDTLEAELKLLGQYGLRNKREIWRHKTLLSKYRGIGRSLLGMSVEERSLLEKQLLNRLHRLGILPEESELDDVLDMTLEDILGRRLQTLVFQRGLSQSIQQARQLIAHGHISIEGRKVSSPSYLVLKDEEETIAYSPKSPLTNPDHPIVKAATIPAEPAPMTEEEKKSE